MFITEGGCGTFVLTCKELIEIGITKKSICSA